jgi:hypothetical protein
MISPKSPGWNGDIQNTVRCGSGVIVLPSENKCGCWISSTNVPCDRSRQPCLVTVRPSADSWTVKLSNSP